VGHVAGSNCALLQKSIHDKYEFNNQNTKKHEENTNEMQV